ncbi:MAG: hypothetical protein O2984_01970 [Bacteroidetes bacterium]|nr:hypothetical protein [Bacteroidota bacterium]
MLAQTKMPSFTLPIAAFVFIALACLIDSILIKIKNLLGASTYTSLILTPVLIILLVFCRLDFPTLKTEHALFGEFNHHSEMLHQNKAIFKNLKNSLPDNTLVFNVKGRHYIECMFYSGFQSYQKMPSFKECESLIIKGYTIAIFKGGNDFFDTELLQHPKIILLEEMVQGYE